MFLELNHVQYLYMRAWWKKAIGSLILLGILSSQLAAPLAVTAQTEPPQEYVVGGVEISDEDIAAAVESPTPNLANTTAYILLTISWIFRSGLVDPNAFSVAEDSVPDSSSTTTYNRSKDLNQAISSGGVVGGVTYLMAGMIKNPPATSSRYVAKVIRDSRFSPDPVYAQGFGIGFGALDPILETWAAFRDIAYFLLTVMFLVTGLLIIFRKKVSGNVAVSVQNALPRLVITLILITFSYAIAGFVVDLMFWGVYFTIFIFSTLFESSPYGDSLAQFALDKSIFHIFFGFLTSGGVTNVADALADIVIKGVKEAIPIIDDIPDPVGLFGWIIQSIFVLIIGIAMLIQVFRVFFQLLMSYAGFVINVVLSPFILLQGAWPGKNPFQKWFMNLLAGLAPFVVVIFMLFMAFVLAGVNTPDEIGYKPNNPDQTGLRLPLILTQDFNPAAMMGVLSLGFIMLLPEAVKMTKDFLGVKGGPFDELKDKAMGNLMKGWEGNKYVPGAKKLAGLGMLGAAAGAAGGVAVGAGGGALAGQQGARALGLGARGQRVGQVVGGLAGAFGGGALLSPTMAAGGFAVGAGGAAGASAINTYGVKPVKGVYKYYKNNIEKPVKAADQGFVALKQSRRFGQADRNVGRAAGPTESTQNVPTAPNNPTNPTGQGTGSFGG